MLTELHYEPKLASFQTYVNTRLSHRFQLVLSELHYGEIFT